MWTLEINYLSVVKDLLSLKLVIMENPRYCINYFQLCTIGELSQVKKLFWNHVVSNLIF